MRRNTFDDKKEEIKTIDKSLRNVCRRLTDAQGDLAPTQLYFRQLG